MNFEDLIRLVADDANIPRNAARAAIDSLCRVINNLVVGDTHVRLPGLGTFCRTHTAEHPGRNPRTGEPITIAASSRLAFRPVKGNRKNKD